MNKRRSFYTVLAGMALVAMGSASTVSADHLGAHMPLVSGAEQGAPLVTTFKSPTCGCCADWEDHLREEGFSVRSIETHDMGSIKAEAGVPNGLGSCHSAHVEGYVVEGHVPAGAIRKLLSERPEGVHGIAVPGMPIGSPGMEVPGRAAESFDVIAFDERGRTTVYKSY